ncbi:sensor histidine kinase [Sinosporangium siamense]|uniref:Oxygen sensor histidine kinase NreB n=1 Tax=Sinosporangium siamense TaxID=1367973 RepID=A0A919V5N7_9ACTN|nr:histidine kinase [Sinosporangium siamense]GII90107.1 hypothetical protein Ssi02_03380 [Sinosporangium siamense]
MRARAQVVARIGAVAVAVVSTALVVAHLWVGSGLPDNEATPLPFTAEDVAGVTFPAFGALLIHHRPALWIGWLLSLGGLASAANILLTGLAHLTALQGGPTRTLWLGVSVTWNIATLLLAVLLPLLYPTGRLVSPRWRWAAVATAAVLALDTLRELVRPPRAPHDTNPFAIEGFAPYHLTSRTLLGWLIALAMIVAFASLAVRFRRADAGERRQILWPLLAIGAVVVPWAVGNPLWWAAALTLPLVPAAIASAVLRYRLFGIDTLITRALVGAGLLAVVAVVYFAVTAAAGIVLSGLDRVAGLAAALFAGVFFHPIRKMFRRGADRLLYGTAGDPVTLAEELRLRLQRADPAEGLAATTAALRAGLGATWTGIDVGGTVTVSGERGAAVRELPLVWHGEPVGTLLLGPPSPRAFPVAHDERVLAALVPYAADAAHAVRLAAELRDSRRRILAAREEERRRLRRDLHDGLGQSLSGMAMSLNAARVSLRNSPARAEELLDGLRTGMSAVTSDIRELVYGLRPPKLDELGLADAVRGLTGDGAVVEAGDLGPLPAAAEVAAYRIVQEALTNARRHAGPARVTVRLAREESPHVAVMGSGARRRREVLRVVVEDDGLGVREQAPRGVGMSSMRERAAELGGVCTVSPRPGGGTLVEAALPL